MDIHYINVLKSSNQNSMGFQIPTSELSEVPRLPRLPRLPRCWAVATNVSAAWHPTGRPPGAPGGSTTRGLQKAYCWPSSTGCAAPESHGIGIHDIHGGWVRSYLNLTYTLEDLGGFRCPVFEDMTHMISYDHTIPPYQTQLGLGSQGLGSASNKVATKG